MISTTIFISIIGALSAIIVSLIGAWYANHNNIVLQTRKLKENHYVSYVEALHGLTSNNQSKDALKDYVFARDKLFIIASELVINNLLTYEKEGVGLNISPEKHDFYLTELIKAIRKDLKIKDIQFPQIGFKKA